MNETDWNGNIEAVQSGFYPEAEMIFVVSLLVLPATTKPIFRLFFLSKKHTLKNSPPHQKGFARDLNNKTLLTFHLSKIVLPPPLT